ncbi:GDSL-type esterase/lipase family protein [Bacillus sp. JJ634]
MKIKRGKYVVIGDSLSTGTLSLFRDMPTWLSFKFKKVVINGGIWSNTLQQVYDRLDADVVVYKLQHAIILCGTNNINNSDTEANIRTYITNITDKIQENNISPIWLTILLRTDNASLLQKIINRNYWLQNFCRVNGLVFVDIYSSLLTNEESVLSVKSGVLLEDLLHLTADGHRIVAETVYTAIKNNDSIELPNICGGDVSTTIGNNKFFVFSN